MSFNLPTIIQGGMGAGVSGWRLAQAVSKLGHLGVIAGTALDEILARRLQDGDPGGHIRHALANFPFQSMSRRIIDRYFIPDGRSPDVPYLTRRMHTLEGCRDTHEMSMAGNFVEVFLARCGHSNPVGINYLEKIQLPHLSSLYGALLAGVAVVIMGAGIPLEIPDVLEALTHHQPAEYSVHVIGASRDAKYRVRFDPRELCDGIALSPMPVPAFLPIISSETLATVLVRKTGGRLVGFIIENSQAGGHNAPPRGVSLLTSDGQPLYGDRDVVNLQSFRKLGQPFWLAGSYGSAEDLKKALDAGAAGIQVGSAFALCRESSMVSEARQALIQKALKGTARVYTDPVASPTGFPFKVAAMKGSLSEQAVYEKRRRVCDLGFLRTMYLRKDGQIGYRCPAEPVAAYLAKEGNREDTVGRQCLCNALIANIGMPQVLADGSHAKCLITLGDDFVNIGRFCSLKQPDYGAEDVIRVLTKGVST